jgi:hypothetical protein
MCRGVRLHLCSLLLALTSPALGQNAVSVQGDGVVPWTLALEQRLQPWCPAACVSEVAFTARYRSNEDVLVFVCAPRALERYARADDRRLRASLPAIVIVEGFNFVKANRTPDEASRCRTPQQMTTPRVNRIRSLTGAQGTASVRWR